MKNKKILGIILAIFCISLLGSSFAYITLRLVGEKHTKISSGTLSLSLTEQENSIELENAIPIKEEEGIKQTPFTFSIENTGNVESYYTVYLIDDVILDTEMRLDDKYIDVLFIKEPGENQEERIERLKDFAYHNVTIDETSVKGQVLDTGKILPQQKKNYSITMWLDYDADNGAMGKVFSKKIFVTADQKIDTVVAINPDGSGASVPYEVRGLIPVYYDDVDEVWRKADASNKDNSWFNYEEQRWANAVTVLEFGLKNRIEYLAAPVGTEIPMTDINTMWVWIPRFSYTIKSENGTNFYGKGGTSSALPGEIDVKFVSKDVKDVGTAQYIGDTADNYLTHPGFTFGRQELSGMWIGKFETNGTTSSTINVKPDIVSSSSNVSTTFKAAQGILNETARFGFDKSGDSILDSRMMKSTEWSAVAYLSQSKYGKYGNENYSGAEKEVFINNSQGYYTGRSGGSYGGNTPINKTYTDQTSTTQYNSAGFYTYNDYLIEYGTNNPTTTKVPGKGTGASTTGNIYGIYDMSGGKWEYVMGNFNNTIGSSGFTEMPDPKYYDFYATSDYANACDGGPCKGIYDTRSWYKDYYYMPDASSPWVLRGGDSVSGASLAFSFSLLEVVFGAPSALWFPGTSDDRSYNSFQI